MSLYPATAEAIATENLSAPTPPTTEKPPFKSPLAKFIDAYCQKCPDYRKDGCCNVTTDKGRNRMFLCISLLDGFGACMCSGFYGQP